MDESRLSAVDSPLQAGNAEIHLMGVNGVGMAGLTYLLHKRGLHVTGCDLAAGEQTAWLQRAGISVHIGHNPDHVHAHTGWMIHSAAVPADHPEVETARLQGVSVALRGEVLPRFLDQGPSVAVCGTHGKTTTTAMIVQGLRAARRDPSFFIGGMVDALGGVAGAGTEPVMIAEADESDGTLAHYAPTMTVITNIDYDHMENFATETAFRDCFYRVADATRERVIYCGDDPVAAAVGGARPNSIAYGLDPRHAYSARILEDNAYDQVFELVRRGQSAGMVTLPVPGGHNLLNALAAWAVMEHLGCSAEEAGLGLGRFQPVRRRLEMKAGGGGITVYSDYAHHPTEIRALIDVALNMQPTRLLAVFQPHRYTRNRALGERFPAAFKGVDMLVLTPVYAASEQPIPGGATTDLLPHFAEFGEVPLRYETSLEKAWQTLRRELRKGDILLIIGAGDVEIMGNWAADELGEHGLTD